MYKKLDLDFGAIDLSLIKGDPNNSYGKTFIEHPVKHLEYVLDIIRPKIKFNIRPNRINITDIISPGADPHCDHWPVALNYYFDADGNDTTYFYKLKNENEYQHREVKIYNKNDLQVVDSFIANRGDCYLLNTHAPHAVYMATENSVRTMLRFTWFNQTFDDVLNSIEII